MRICRAATTVVATVGVGCLALYCSGTAQAQVKLEHKFPEGKKLTYKETSKTRQVLNTMTMQIDSEEDKTVVFSLTAGKRRGDSNRPVEKKTESLRAELSLPGDIKFAYDSSKPNAKIEKAEFAFLADLFKLESGIAYTVVLDDQNKVKGIEGAEKVQAKVDQLDAAARDVVRSQYEPDKLKRMFEQELNVLPDVLARPGEPWERTEVLEIGGGQSLTFRKKYEYAGTEKKGDKTLDKITSKVIEVKYKQDPDVNTALKTTKSELKAESSAGTILFNRDDGCVVENKGRTRIRGSMTFSANDMNVLGTLDLRIETNIELEPAAK
jgi:hypothetical protein